MATSVLDARDAIARPHVRVPAAAASTAVRRIPVAVVAAALLGVVEAVGLLAVSITGLDGVLAVTGRPSGWLVGAGLVVVAAWIVLCAGSAAALVDGAGRSLLTGVAYAEMVLVTGVLGAATVTAVPTPTALPLPALGLLALAVPVGKLLLAGAPSARQWTAQGPRARVRRPDPVQAHRALATGTLCVIGAALCALAVLTPVADGAPSDPASAVFIQD